MLHRARSCAPATPAALRCVAAQVSVAAWLSAERLWLLIATYRATIGGWIGGEASGVADEWVRPIRTQRDHRRAEASETSAPVR